MSTLHMQSLNELHILRSDDKDTQHVIRLTVTVDPELTFPFNRMNDQLRKQWEELV